MEPIISNLLTRFENGSLSRRELVQGLAMLAASGTAAAAQEDIDFKGADIDHVSVQVADMQRSVDFYEKMFGFSVISQDQPHGIVRLGTTRTLVSLNRQSPAGIVDHFAIGVPRFSKESRHAMWHSVVRVRKTIPMPGCTSRIPMGLTSRSFLRGDWRKRSPRYSKAVATDERVSTK